MSFSSPAVVRNSVFRHHQTLRRVSQRKRRTKKVRICYTGLSLTRNVYSRPKRSFRRIDLPPYAPSFITRVCRSGFHILRGRFGQARRAFSISETCYRYQPELSDENGLIADWLVALTNAKKTWGFGLCFLHLRNMKGFRWNHKRVYRIYRQLELNMRIKSRKRLQREKPEPLAVPEAPNELWSIGGWQNVPDTECAG